MNYIEYLNGFNVWLESHALEPVPQLLYFKLLNIFNRAGWPESVQVDNQRIMSVTGQKTEKSAIAARDKLVSSGLIYYQRGKKGCPGRYSLNSGIYSKNSTVKNTVENIHCKKSAFPVNNEGCNTGIIGEEERQTYNTNTKTKTKNISPPTPQRGERPAPAAFDPPPESAFPELPELTKTLAEWLAYKQEKRQGYKPTGYKSLLTQIRNNVSQYGESAVVDLIRQSMAANWQGIVWDKLRKGETAQQTGQKQEHGKYYYDYGDTTGSL